MIFFNKILYPANIMIFMVALQVKNGKGILAAVVYLYHKSFGCGRRQKIKSTAKPASDPGNTGVAIEITEIANYRRIMKC